MVTFLPLKSTVLLKVVHTVISFYSTGGRHPKLGRGALHVTTPALVPPPPGLETLYKTVFQGDRSPFTADTGAGISCSAQGWRGGRTAPHRRDSGLPEETKSILKTGSGAGKAGLLRQERQTFKLLLQPQTLREGDRGPRSPGHGGTFAESCHPISQWLLPMLSPLCVRSSICLLQVPPPQRSLVTWAGRGGSDLHEAPPPPDGVEASKGPDPHLQPRRLRRLHPARVPTMAWTLLLLGLLAYGSGQGPGLCTLGAPPSRVSGHFISITTAFFFCLS